MIYQTKADRLLVHIAFLLVLTVSAFSHELPMVEPEAVGLSTERLSRIDKVMEMHVAQQKIAGGVTLLARHGKIAHLGVYGMMDVEAEKPMTPDTIFRIASMTKPITSVAVMMLYEEGHFRLHEPVSKFIPSFKEMHVLPPEDAEDSVQPIPATRQITIWNLLTHTAGLTYHWNGRLGQQYTDAGITHGLLQDESTLEEKMKILATIPLLHQPGADVEYGLSIDVLGYLVEVVSGMSLDAFFSERIFKPLGMKDTHFFIPETKRERLATVYERTKDGPIIRKSQEPTVDGALIYSTDYPYNGPRTYFAGGGGLVSTASDYLRFAQMMLNGGKFNGVRLLSRKTVELMTSNQLTKMDVDYGFGLGFGIVRDESDLREIGSVGRYGWGGFFFTNFFIDPQEQMIGIFLCQLHPSGGLDLGERIRILSYQAIAD
ncbi:beta-lactamase family protein [Candidatus Poribacteria bacterium]|nr:beta-lactamase family protein [Candidatus Poribacteria bacterium]